MQFQQLSVQSQYYFIDISNQSTLYSLDYFETNATHNIPFIDIPVCIFKDRNAFAIINTILFSHLK